MLVQRTSLLSHHELHNSGKASSYQKKIFLYILENGAKTCDEVENELKLRHQTASSQIRELVKKGMLEDSEEKRYTRSKRKAIVWRAKIKDDLFNE